MPLSLCFLCLLSLSAPAAAEWISAHRWQQRLVVVQGLSSNAVAAALRQHDHALRERRMAVWLLQGEQLGWIGGAEPLAAPPTHGPALDSLRRALRKAPEGSTLYLFGLDGGLKGAVARPEQLVELIQAVDSMPMRAREIRR
ncbi:MAG: DUF4174 domain-containing protein [Aquimonas sp.]|nr:DUF4174 domain-containing protein [Aquimonas sp.]